MDNRTLHSLSTLSSLTTDFPGRINKKIDISNRIDMIETVKNKDKNNSIHEKTSSIAKTISTNLSTNKLINPPNNSFLKKEHCNPCDNSIYISPSKACSTVIEHTVVIDVAALCQEYSPVDVTCDNNITILDDIYIPLDIFIQIFYPDLNHFGIDKQICKNPTIFPFISLEHTYRSVNKTPFFLCNTILKGIENDLNIPRNCFTPSSLIEITKEFTNIKSLCDLNCCSVVASLSWDNILTIIQNYETCHKKEVIPILTVSIMFKTPTPGVKTNVIKMPYRICSKKENS
jgi:uncharacterized protein (UPF0147 family)